MSQSLALIWVYSGRWSWSWQCAYRRLFLRKHMVDIMLDIFQHWFRWWLGANHATSHYLNRWWLVYWRIYASPDLNKLINPMMLLSNSIWNYITVGHRLKCGTTTNKIERVILFDYRLRSLSWGKIFLLQTMRKWHEKSLCHQILLKYLFSARPKRRVLVRSKGDSTLITMTMYDIPHQILYCRAHEWLVLSKFYNVSRTFKL